jgi:hypothetical protein
MERFTDQPLGPRPHIAVFGSDKVGNFVLTTPLLRGLKEKYPGAMLDFFGGATTRAWRPPAAMSTRASRHMANARITWAS